LNASRIRRRNKVNPTYKDEILIRRYLLGEMTGQEREQIEQRLMTDSQYFHHFLRAEEDLIDEYVKGGLIEDEREQFETHFLSAPERRDRLEFAKSLNKYIAKTETPESAGVANAGGEAARSRGVIFWLRQNPGRAATALLAVAMSVLLAGTITLLIENARLKDQMLGRQADLRQVEEGLQRQLGEQLERNEGLARQLEQSQNEASRIKQELATIKQGKRHQTPNLPSKIARMIPSRATSLPNQQSKIYTGSIDNLALLTPGIVSLTIAPGLVRDIGQTNRVFLTNDIQQLRLELKLQVEDYENYRAEVQTVEGKSVWRDDNLRARGRTGEKTIVTTLPAMRFPEGDYLVTLSATEAGGDYEVIATYSFTILRK
jgi:hypothetical protein